MQIEHPKDRRSRFIAEGELHPLAKRLRMLGIDCMYDGGASISEIIRNAVEQNRIMLTKKTIPEIGKLNVYILKSDEPAKQLLSVVQTFNLEPQFNPFTRCLTCNSELRRVDKTELDSASIENVPDSVIERGLELSHCDRCNKFVWHGSHVARMIQRLKESGIEVNIQDRN